MATAFEEMGVCAELLRVVEEQDWLVPTPIQTEAIPLLLGGGDVLAAAETGSGKTGAFIIPLLQVIQESLLDATDDKPTESKAAKPKAKGSTMSFEWSLHDKDAQLSVSTDGFVASSNDNKRWLGVRGAVGVRSRGKYYFECQLTRCEGIVRVGWSTIAASLDLGTDRHGYGYGGTGKKAHQRQFIEYGEPFGSGDVIGCFLDLDQRIVRFAQNGSMYDAAFHLGPTTKATAYFPAVCLKNADVELHCEPSSFPYPMEFVDLMHANRDLLVPSSSSMDPDGLPGMPGNSSVVVRPRGIILEPARDIAQQVLDCARVFNKYLTSPKVRVSLCVGGISLKDQLQKLELTGGCDLIIATPGRLMEMLERGFLDLASTRLFVLDEVDQLISTDNVPAILKIHETLAHHAPKTGPQRLQVSFFSATLHGDGVMELADKVCHHPQLVDLQGKAVVPATVHHVMLSVDPRQDISSVPKTVPSPSTDAVHDTTTREKVAQYIQNARQGWPLGADKDTKSQILKYLKPNLLVQLLDALAIEQCMVFCRTNLDCDLLEAYLLQLGGPDMRQVFTGDKLERGREHPYSCCVLAGLRSMTSRHKALEAFKDGDVRILICTDVAARGIDVPRLACVINLTLPDSVDGYIHRIGRVGRSERLGLAISLVAADNIRERVWYHKCSKQRGGTTCTKRQLVDDGGCTIWYDEPSLRRNIEKRLQQGAETVASVNELIAAIQRRGGMKQYGAERSKDLKETRSELLRLAPHVKTLAALEEQVQCSWLTMQQAVTRGQRL